MPPEITKEEIADVLDNALKGRYPMGTEKHHKHHEFIQMEIERRQRSKERWEKFQSSFIGGLALGILGALGWLGTLVINWLKYRQ